MMMTRLTTIVGALLVLTGVVAFVVTSTSSVTALIPAFVGGPAADLRRHLEPAERCTGTASTPPWWSRCSVRWAR